MADRRLFGRVWCSIRGGQSLNDGELIAVALGPASLTLLAASLLLSGDEFFDLGFVEFSAAYKGHIPICRVVLKVFGVEAIAKPTE